MKVDNSKITNNSALNVNRAQEAEQAHQTGKAKQAGRGGADRVEMSGTASVLHGESAARTEKVAQLTEAVQSGRYRVDSHKVGKAIVNASVKGEE